MFRFSHFRGVFQGMHLSTICMGCSSRLGFSPIGVLASGFDSGALSCMYGGLYDQISSVARLCWDFTGGLWGGGDAEVVA